MTLAHQVVAAPTAFFYDFKGAVDRKTTLELTISRLAFSSFSDSSDWEAVVVPRYLNCSAHTHTELFDEYPQPRDPLRKSAMAGGKKSVRATQVCETYL